jgi:glucose/arabinose dehydrogenase
MINKILLLLLISSFSIITNAQSTKVKTAVEEISLPDPYATPSARNNSKTIGWPDDKIPVAPNGFTVTKFASGLDNPRWMYVAPNGDIFVAEANTVSDGFKKTGIESNSRNTSKNCIILLRDANHDGVPEMQQLFLSGLNRPFGMLILNGKFYVGNTDGVWMYPYKTGQTQMAAQGTKILDLPGSGYNNHWTRNLLASRDGKKIYVTVGSSSNVAYQNKRMAIHKNPLP